MTLAEYEVSLRENPLLSERDIERMVRKKQEEIEGEE